MHDTRISAVLALLLSVPMLSPVSGAVADDKSSPSQAAAPGVGDTADGLLKEMSNY